MKRRLIWARSNSGQSLPHMSFALESAGYPRIDIETSFLQKKMAYHVRRWSASDIGYLGPKKTTASAWESEMGIDGGTPYLPPGKEYCR
ncbi:hypothetical protein GP486_004790 [Trichoglossum hirsutum]|uniref:Uncharacterized protein n=1 Tax=Trichoglossum hirsutum TaxID=265104 RepID=A0A9P8LAI0_9PEZI|nr:hypothetical protein GP486_004790 [Trichoglossum hirsutum]